MQVSHLDAFLRHSLLIQGHLDGCIEVQVEECGGQHTALAANTRGDWELAISPDGCSGVFMQGSNDGQQLLCQLVYTNAKESAKESRSALNQLSS